VAKKTNKRGCFDFLKPHKINTIFTIIILALPILKERVPLEQGGFVVERYSPIVLVGSYIWLRDLYALILMLGFSLFVYITTSIGTVLLKKVLRLFK